MRGWTKFFHANCAAGEDALPYQGIGNAAQLKALDLIAINCRRLLDKVREYENTVSEVKAPSDVLDMFLGTDVDPPASLVADSVDLPTLAGTCDPLLYIDPAIGSELRHPG